MGTCGIGIASTNDYGSRKKALTVVRLLPDPAVLVRQLAR